MSMTYPSKPESETGAILPMFGLLIIVLLVFAAFAVDLGAAWAERRQLQSAADAGAMAGVLPPLAIGDNIATAAMDYVDANVATPVDRFGCTGWTPASEGVSGAFDLADPTESNCVWVSTDTDGTETLVAVKVPSQEVPTAFARVIGIDSIPVEAFAVAQIESIRSAHVLPFALKPNPSSNECLGSQPAGLSRDPCSGSTTGNYGYLTSPLHGSTDLGTDPTCPPGGLGDKPITVMNMAIGTDHPVQNDVKWPPLGSVNNALADDDLPDDCVGFAAPTAYTPDSVVFCTECGASELHEGLVSNTLHGTHGTPSRLQQNLKAGTGSDGISDTRTILDQPASNSLVLDNIGLWEYVIGGVGHCAPGVWQTAGGQPATERMEKCLAVNGDSVVFSPALWSSPRFAVVPELWDDFPAGASTPRAIQRFRGVYLHATWFNCSAAGSASDCLLFTDVDGVDQPVFYPGEGDDDACLPLGASGKCGESQIQGLSSLVLPIHSVPDDIINGLSPNVRLLYR